MTESAGGGKRVAFFGGSFDPPHLGHLGVARAAIEALGLDTVLFAPVGAQPLKAQGSTANFEDRLAMTELAIGGEPCFGISLADAPRPDGSPNYTLDALLALRAELPADSSLFCLMGADSLMGLRRWHRAVEIPFVATLIVASRPGQMLVDLVPLLPAGLSLVDTHAMESEEGKPTLKSYLVENSRGERAAFYLLPGVHLDISASEIRRQVRNATGELDSGQELLPKAVHDWILARGLYRQEEP
jgi:nicotinate-nucleotide adenylyltransferase